MFFLPNFFFNVFRIEVKAMTMYLRSSKFETLRDERAKGSL